MRWVESEACEKENSQIVYKFVKKNIFSHFGMPRAIISDGGAHFNNDLFDHLLSKYGVRHKVTTP